MNLNHFWEGALGILAFPVFIVYVIIFLVLAVICLASIIKAFGENFSNRNRNWTIGVMAVCLALLFFKPRGVIKFHKMEGGNVFIAEIEGAANCRTTLKLKPNNRYYERSVCFAVSKSTGYYEKRNDTVFFFHRRDSIDIPMYYEFGLLKESKYSNDIAFFRYRNRRDSIGQELRIVKNEIWK